MQLNISQQMKMSQQMKLAPRMIQSMEILQLNLMALNERIEQELVDNVTLELVEKEDADAKPRDTESSNDVVDERITTADNGEQPVDVQEKELVVDEGSNNISR